MRRGVQFSGVAADRLAEGVLDVPAALLGGGRRPTAAAPPAPPGWSRSARRGCGVGRPARPARRTSAAPQAAAGCERETPSVGERRCFSACLISSQPASTWATSRGPASPKTCGWRRTSLSTRSPATSSTSNRRSGGGLGGDPGVEDHLQQDVAELLAHGGRVVVDDRVVGLVRLLEQVAAQRGVRLLGVPRAAARRAQPVHHRDDVEQPGAGRFGGAVDDLGARGHLVRRGEDDDVRRSACRRVRDVGDVPAVGPQRVRGGRGTGQRGERAGRRRAPASPPGSAGPAGGG